jgi:hypothetical protein
MRGLEYQGEQGMIRAVLIASPPWRVISFKGASQVFTETMPYSFWGDEQ